jgi:hypothetical protein
MRRNYWSCSKFADWLRGTPKPKAGTAEEWNAWEKRAKAKKRRYWLAEEGLDILQNIICWPLDFSRNIRHYVDNRWVHKTHALTSSLERGHWHELDTRLLYSVFDELVNFVEIEQALRYVSSFDKKQKKSRPAGYKCIRIGRWRDPEAGLAYLEWAANLKQDEEWVDKDDPQFGHSTPQALAAQETITLYKWWKEKRPKRPDPMDASGWSAYCEERRRSKNDHDISFWDDSTDIANRSHEILELCHKIEREQEDEDTEMLIRLIKIRGNLWT